MAYKYVTFDGVSLPLYDHSQEHAPMPAESSLIDSIGGVFDWRGADRVPGRKQTISAPGVYVGETEYLVDETGDYLVDETGDRLIVGNGQEVLAAQIAALAEKIGVRGPLWRERLHDGALQWKTARLLQVSWPRTWEDHALKAALTPVFESAMQFWHAETASMSSVNAVDGIPVPLLVENTGQIIDDAVLTIICTSGTITAVSVTCSALSIDLDWTGSLTTGVQLVIDNGGQTIPAGGVDGYSGLTLGGSHTAAGWIPLGQGQSTFMVTVTGGNAAVFLEYYNQYA